MAIQVQWAGNDQRLIHMTFEGEWDWRAFYAAAGNVVRLMVAAEHPVDVLMDLRHTTPVPTDFLFRARLASFYRRNIGTIVLVQNTAALRDAARLAHPRKSNHDTSSETLTAATLKEADTLIQRHRAQREPLHTRIRPRFMSFLFG